MIKREDWRSSLSEYLESKRNDYFKYGVNDCALFAAGAIEAMTGEDIAKEYRGKYSTYIGGLRKVRVDGYKFHYSIFEDKLTEIPVSFASFGDIGFYKTELDGVYSVGVVLGHKSAVITDTGFSLIDTTDLYKTFRI